MKAMRKVVILVGRCTPRLVKINHDDLPERLRKVYPRRAPLFRLDEPVDMVWRAWRIRILPGFFTDLASIPMFLSILGISRFTRDGRLDLGSLFHDGVYRGAARFCDDDRENRRLADQMLIEVWMHCKTPPRQAHRYYRRVRRWGWLSYKPNPGQHAGRMMTTRRADFVGDSDLRHAMVCDNA